MCILNSGSGSYFFFSYFTAVCDDLLLHNNVRLLSKGWILKRFLAVRKDLEMFLLE